MILELFTTAQSNPWQSEWLDKLDEDYKKACESPDDSVWMQLALSDYRNSMEDVLRELQKAWNLTQEFDGPQMYAGAIKSDLELVETLCTRYLCRYCAGIDRASCLCTTCGGTGL